VVREKCYMLTLQNRVNSEERNRLTQNRNTPWRPYWGREGLITAIAFGGFLILVGVVFAITPDLYSKIEAFFRNLETISFPAGSSSTFMLPAPVNPSAHNVLYTAVMQFDIGFGILQALILAIRLGFRSPIRKIAETVDHLIFWFGAAVLVNSFLLLGTTTAWFEYWASLIVLIGIGVIARALILIAARKKTPTPTTTST
jgi:hypothetical protein